MNLNFPEPSGPPCPECPEQYLTDYLATPVGQLIAMVCNLDFALQAGITVDLRDVPYPEFVLLRQLTDERETHNAEQIKKPPR